MIGAGRGDGDAGLVARDRGRDGVGRGDRPGADGLEGDGEGAGAAAQGVVGGQAGVDVRAGDLDDPGVGGVGVAEGVLGGDGDGVGDARHDRTRIARDDEVIGAGRGDGNVPRRPDEGYVFIVDGRHRLRPRRLERDVERALAGDEVHRHGEACVSVTAAQQRRAYVGGVECVRRGVCSDGAGIDLSRRDRARAGDHIMVRAVRQGGRRNQAQHQDGDDERRSQPQQAVGRPRASMEHRVDHRNCPSASVGDSIQTAHVAASFATSTTPASSKVGDDEDRD